MVGKPFTKKTSKALFLFLAHGNELHKAWLEEAIEAFRLGLPKPESRQ